MSNYELRSKLSQLEAELRRVERINAELRSELWTVANGVENADRELEQYNAAIRYALENCDGIMQSSHQTVVNAIELQGEIDRLYVKFKNVELANKKIRGCNNKKYYDFANYRTVRKLVQGMMDNLEVQMVSDNIVTKSVEVQHLQTPDYWLTCALISIMAWRNDDKELADRAIARAMGFDKKNTAVFYMLFNLRMGREDAALKWFRTYEECEMKGSDNRTFLLLFSLVSRTLTDNVSPQAKTEVSSFIRKVIEANARSAGYSEEGVVEQIRSYFNRMQPNEELEYTMLRKHCAEFSLLTTVMMQAKNNINILQFILKTVNVPVDEKNVFIKNYIDELISAPNQTEKDVYDEIAYNELIIRYDGDVEMAKEKFAADQKRKENDINLIAEMIDWVYDRDAQDVNGQVRLNMFRLTKGLQMKAVGAHVDNYRKNLRSEYSVRIGEYSTVANFRKENEEYQKISDYFVGVKERAKTEVKDWPAFLGFGIAAAAAVGSFFVGFWLLIATVCGAGFGVIKLLSNSAERKHLERKCEDDIKKTSMIMQELFIEFKQYLTEVYEYDAFSQRISEELNKI